MNDLPAPAPAPDFREILDLIASARQRAYQAVNTALIDLYWQVDEHLSRKLASAEWGEGVMPHLARHIATTYPGLRGFTRRNLFRMRQFYETYRDQQFVSPLVTQIHPEALSSSRTATCSNSSISRPATARRISIRACYSSSAISSSSWAATFASSARNTCSKSAAKISASISSSTIAGSNPS